MKGGDDVILRIRELRLSLGITQEELATLAGVTQSTVTSWETETYLPRTRDLPRIAHIFGVSINDLYTPEALIAS